MLNCKNKPKNLQMHSLRFFLCLQRGIDVAYESIGGEVFETCLNRYEVYFA